MKPGSIKFFLLPSLLWLVIGLALNGWLNSADPQLWNSFKWFTGLWVLCLFDLYALSRTLEAALGLMNEESEKRSALTIQAFYWGTIKLACLGIFGTILLKGDSIPATSLLLGLGTLIVVPLMGWYWWSHRILRHAS